MVVAGRLEMATYRFRTTKAFGRDGITHFAVDSAEEVEVVKAFMLRIAPEIARNSARTDTSAEDNAEMTLYWAMNLTAKYTAFAHEALRSIEKENPAQEPQQETPQPRGSLHPPRHDMDA